LKRHNDPFLLPSSAGAENVREAAREARKETADMRKTIADSIRDDTRLEEKRATVLRLLRAKFKQVSPAVEATIQATTDSHRLDAWQEGVATARRLNDISFTDN
jgi:hypothetical protein